MDSCSRASLRVVLISYFLFPSNHSARSFQFTPPRIRQSSQYLSCLSDDINVSPSSVHADLRYGKSNMQVSFSASTPLKLYLKWYFLQFLGFIGKQKLRGVLDGSPRTSRVDKVPCKIEDQRLTIRSVADWYSEKYKIRRNNNCCHRWRNI